jgi:hypothetical protein
MNRLLLATLLLSACAGSSASELGPGGTGGTSGTPCTKLSCLPPVTTHFNCAVQIDPPSSSTAATTQLPSVDLYGVSSGITLTTYADTPVNVTFTAANGSAPSTANAVLTVPSLIGGLPALTFQAPATPSPSMATVLTATVSVASNVVGTDASLALIPLPPADQQSPPYTSSVIVATSLNMPIAENDVPMGGSLELANQVPPTTTFVARAFQAGVLASNAPLTPTTGPSAGKFQLLLPGNVVAAGRPLTVQVTPTGPTDPWFVSTPVAPPFPLMLPTIVLSAYTAPTPFTVVVQGPGGAGDPVAGATVKASAILPPTTQGSTLSGSTQFSNSGLTDANGNVALSLLPGTAGNPQSYALTVIPPAGSPYATSCNSSASVPPTGSMPPVTLMPRPILAGMVLDAAGHGVSGVAVAATPIANSSDTCSRASGSTSTAADGSFSLPLDPGMYQLDYDPPVGAGVPRLTESPVTVSTTPHVAQLRAGALVSGQVLSPPPDSTTLALATVRLYEPQCSSYYCGPNVPPPVLLGQAVTDANGHFQIVIPQP